MTTALKRFYRLFGRPSFGDRQQIDFLKKYDAVMSGQAPVERYSKWISGYLTHEGDGKWVFNASLIPEEQQSSLVAIVCPGCRFKTSYIIHHSPNAPAQDADECCSYCDIRFCQHDDNDSDVFVKSYTVT